MQVLTGFCPNSDCGKQLYFASDVESLVECTGCSQDHYPKNLIDVKPVTNPTLAIQNLLQSMLVKALPVSYKRNNDSIKVKGLSNYGSKLISPLLTRYGLDKSTQQVRLLETMGQGDTFDCSHLADYAFRIEEKKLLISGYGRDVSAEYLADTLKEISNVNDNEERIVPIHADGDGHCLLHAVSRALVGHELFWHPLMKNLKDHLILRKDDYKNLLSDFFEDSDWDSIIREADPNYLPATGEVFGLRNIHIFGLANVLHRPILLLDSLEGMQSKGDYAAMFVPALTPVEKCQNKEKTLHKPIVIAWSSKGRNHFVPLVGIKEKPLPKIPNYMLPKLWGLPQELLTQYIDFDSGSCIIGGGKALTEQYLTKLATAMEKHFTVLNGVAPIVVQDVYQYIIQPNSAIQVTTEVVTETARSIVKEERLYRCLLCKVVFEEANPCQLSWLEPDGELYEIAKKTHGTLKDGYKYKFPHHNNITCSYNAAKDRLMFVQNVDTLRCKHCQGSMRMLKADGSLVYFNGDQLLTPASKQSKCNCGFKHYWDGKEYDNLPTNIPVLLEWNNETKSDFVYWFQDESNKSLNSNVYELAQNVVQKHFPGEFGSERLVQKVVDQILRVTLSKKSEEKNKTSIPAEVPPTPTKIILTGAKSKTLHKEELNTSLSEKILKKKIEHGASLKQKRSSTSPLKQLLHGEEHTKKLPEEKSGMQQETKKALPRVPKIRISLANSRTSEVFTLREDTMYADLQSFIEEKFYVPKQEQIIKYGFPPKTLQIPSESSTLFSMKPGERLTVHGMKEQKVDTAESVKMEVDLLNETTTVETSTETSANEDIEPDMFSSFFSSLLQNVNLWDWACTQRSLFQPNGIFYKQAVKDLGFLKNNQHISLPYFPNKIFSYHEQSDELFLCLGETHVHVQELTPEQLILAEKQTEVKNKKVSMHTVQTESQSSLFSTLSHSMSTKSNVVAFSGVGHSMVDNTASDTTLPTAAHLQNNVNFITNENAGKAQQDSSRESITDRLDKENVTDQLNHKNIVEQSRQENMIEQSNYEDITNQSKQESIPDQLNHENVREQTNQENVREQCDHENITEQSDQGYISEKLNHENVFDQSKQESMEQSSQENITDHITHKNIKESNQENSTEKTLADNSKNERTTNDLQESNIDETMHVDSEPIGNSNTDGLSNRMIEDATS